MIPQHNIAEQIVLGLATQDIEIAHRVAKLNNNIFYQSRNKVIHLAITECIQRGYGFDEFSISNMARTIRLKGHETEPVFVGDIIELNENLPPQTQLPAYIKMLEEAQTQRELLEMCSKTADKIGSRLYYQHEIDEIVDGFKKNLFKIKVSDQQEAEYVHQSAFRTVENLEAVLKNGEKQLGIPSGFPALDEKTSGFRPGQLIVFCGRPGMGKTSLALDICSYASSPRHRCERLGYFFSVEMSSDEISTRLLSKLSGVNLKNLRTVEMHNGDLKAISQTALDLANYKIIIDDSSQLSPATIKAKILEREALHDEKPDIIFIDYLQLMAPSRTQNSREREVANMSRELKLLARELNIPVVIMSQLNRELEKRPNKRPIMADIRESGAIEQDADIIIALYQPFFYTNNLSDEGKAEAIILKHRNGPVGTIPMIWRPEISSFAPVLVDGNACSNARSSKQWGQTHETQDVSGGRGIEYNFTQQANDSRVFRETVNKATIPF